MWYACSSTLRPETKATCSLAFSDEDLLWKHMSANKIHYTRIAPEYDIYDDGIKKYTITLGTFPLRTNRTTGMIIGIFFLVVVFIFVLYSIIRFTP